MQLTKTIFQNSAIFIEKKWVENQLWGKSAFLWEKELIHLYFRHGCTGSRTRLTPAASAESAASTRAGSWRSTGVAILLANLRASGGGRRRSTGGRAAAGSPALLSSVSYPAATVARTAVAAVITVTVATVEGLAVTAATAATTRPI